MAEAHALEAPGTLGGHAEDWTKANSPAKDTPRASKRKRAFMVLGTVIALAAAGYTSWWYLVGRNFVTTDDAYTEAEVAAITPRIEGTVTSVPVHNTQHVVRNQVLARLDPADARIALAQAEANYVQAQRKTRGLIADEAAAKAAVQARKADFVRARLDWRRRQALAKTGAVSGDELTNAKNGYETAKAGLDAAERKQAALAALIGKTDVAHNPQVLAAKAARDKAKLDLERATIRAPIAGVVAQNHIQIGQQVQPGAKLMSVVPITRIYVDANFKESELGRVHPGQAVTLTSDLYGPDVVFHGHVVGLSGGTGAAFAVIPAQNATGNWIKVVQRVPVRIALNPAELTAHPLRVGLSMSATIDLRK
jgi:membrane fusion protein (multidrug efflux system)